LIKNLTLALGSACLFLLVVEILLRQASFVATPPLIQPVNKTSPIIHFKPKHKYVFATEWNGEIIVGHTTNGYGFNTAIEFDRGKVANCVIGDSYVEAMHVNAEDSFHGILSGLGFTVYPLGISGSSLSQYVAFAKWAISNFKCKRLLFVIVINDFDESLISYKKNPGYHYLDDNNNGELKLIPYQVSGFKSFLRKFALVNYLYDNLKITGRVNRFINPKRFDSRNADGQGDKLMLSKSAIDYFFHELKTVNLSSNQMAMVLDGDRHSIYDG
jgi:hypothetical protein